MPTEQSEVILLIGPPGGGKTSLGQRIAQNPNWIHISEDNIWDEIGHNPKEFRTPEKQEIVQPLSVKYIQTARADRKRVVFDFLVYERPAVTIGQYQNRLKEIGDTFVTRVLRPSVESLVQRRRGRGRESDRLRDGQEMHSGSQYMVNCLMGDDIRAEWVIDSTGETLEQTYIKYFSALVRESDV